MVLKLQTRVGLVFAAALASLLVVLAVTLGAYHSARNEYATIETVHRPNVEASRRMIELAQATFIDQIIYVDHVVSRTEIKALMARHEREWSVLYHQASGYGETPEEQALLQRIGRDYDALVASGLRVRLALEKNQINEARRLHRDVSRPVFQALMTDVERFHQINLEQIDALIDSSFERFDLARWIAVAVTVLGTLVAAGLWWSASYAVVRPLRTLTGAMKQVGAGTFVEAHDAHAAATEELAALQAGFNRMSNQLHDAGRKLWEANAHLEDQVEDRTAQLLEANRQLERMVSELQTLDQLKSHFLSIMSHELLTPINFIVGFGSTLEDEVLGPLTPQQHEAVARMMEGADRLTRMVRNTLEYTQLEAGELATWPQSVNYEALLTDLAGQLAPMLQAKHQRLSIQAPSPPPTVKADPDRLRQVLGELLDNASKFSAPGAELMLTVSETADEVTTEVTDPGIGLSKEAQAKLFMPFFQVDARNTREHGGMGIGLAIAYHLVAIMGGAMDVASRPGRGTTIRFTLPRPSPSLPHDGETPAAREA